jgi:hypothetical protein
MYLKIREDEWPIARCSGAIYGGGFVTASVLILKLVRAQEILVLELE